MQVQPWPPEDPLSCQGGVVLGGASGRNCVGSESVLASVQRRLGRREMRWRQWQRRSGGASRVGRNMAVHGWLAAQRPAGHGPGPTHSLVLACCGGCLRAAPAPAVEGPNQSPSPRQWVGWSVGPEAWVRWHASPGGDGRCSIPQGGLKGCRGVGDMKAGCVNASDWQHARLSSGRRYALACMRGGACPPDALATRGAGGFLLGRVWTVYVAM